MKWLKRLIFTLIILVVIAGSLFLFARFWIDDIFKDQQITNLNWQIDSIGIKNTRISTIEFTFQNRFNIQIQNLTIHLNFAQNRANKQSHFIDGITIRSLLIDNQSNVWPTQDTTDNTPLINALNNIINLIKRSSQKPVMRSANLSKTPSLINQISANTEYLAYIPKALHIENFQYTQPCRSFNNEISGPINCTAMGRVNWLNQFSDEEISSELALDIQDASQQNLLLQTQLNLSAELEDEQLTNTQLNSVIDLIDQTSKQTSFSQQPIVKLKWQNQTSSVSKNHLNTVLQIQSQPGLVTKNFSTHWQVLNSIYRNWSGENFTFSPSVQPQLNLEMKGEFDLTQFNDSIQSNNAQILLKNLVNHANLSLQFAAESEQPLAIQNLVQINGKLQTELTANQGVITHYHLQGNGELSIINDSPADSKLKQYQVILPQMAFEIKSSNQLAVKLDELKPLELLDKLALSSNSNSSQAQFPFNMILNSSNHKNNPNQNSTHINNNEFKLSLQGLLKLNEQPTIEITAGKLFANLPQIRFNQSNQAKQNRTEFEFTALANQDFWQIHSANGYLTTELTADLTANAPPELKHQTNELSISQAKLSWQGFELVGKARPSRTKQTSTVFNSTIKSVELQANISHPKLQAEKLQAQLKQLSLTPVFIKNTTVNQNLDSYQVNAQYSHSSDKLIEQHLLTQSWKGLGKLKANYSLRSSEISQIQLQGSISNKAGLVVFHNAFYTPSQIMSDWFIPPIYFLAGNSLQKTFTDWPKLISVGSGKIQAQGTTKLRLTDSSSAKPPLDNLYIQGVVSVQGLSGIINETTFNQITSDLTFEVNKKTLALNLKKFHALQINHGVILGPLELAADYQTQVEDLFKGKLNIKQAISKIFNGQAWLDSQAIDLSKPFSSQLHLDEVNIQALLAQYPSVEINGTGTLYGELPFEVNLLKKPYITIQKGFIKAKSPGGLLKYQPASSGLKQTHQSMQLVMSVLEDFHYNLLESQVTYEDDNKLHLKLSLQGNNPAVESGRQVNFNIQLEEDLPALITSMQISNQVSETIKKRIHEKLQNPRF